jgi:hypothetical protein
MIVRNLPKIWAPHAGILPAAGDTIYGQNDWHSGHCTKIAGNIFTFVLAAATIASPNGLPRCALSMADLSAYA